ncbi:RNA-directed DNA polymerase [Pediococcus stilesii]|uniref:RNA-directed DNA polymerase n=1 Tax=Pediococcus stilesii TaxID=331679 RepID=A0A5R9BU29_9LACO|nr:reverse transcriptase domain-containing protein [Pediococcus stilesii]TLQ03512.1 RNA-directed DNA polymerase [Pediococcus stilesii]
MTKFKYNREKKISDFKTRLSFVRELYSIGLNSIDIFKLSKNINNYYTEFTIPKKYGTGVRTISAPLGDLKQIQQIIKKLIENELTYCNYTFGKYNQAFQKNKSIFTNAQIHRNKKYIIHLDLKDFFSSIHFGRISGYLQKNSKFRLTKDMASFIANLCCYNGMLPQGAPTSPIISNLLGESLDRKLLKISKTYHLTYSRYADDLVFSTNDEKIIAQKLSELIEVISTSVKKSGFQLNWDKLNFMGPDVRHLVTGLSNNKRVSSTIDFYKNTRSMALNFYVKNSFYAGKHFYNGYTIRNQQRSMQVLEGRYAFINNIESQNRRLYENHLSGAEYHAITPQDFKDRHNLIKAKKHDEPSFSGKELSYSRFIFFKKFLFGNNISVFTEGKTDPRYIQAAMRALNSDIQLEVTSFQTESDLNTQFSKMFNLTQGGTSLKRIIDLYKGTNYQYGKRALSAYYNYFDLDNSKIKFVPMKPCILLLDFELLGPTSPLQTIINRLMGARKNSYTIDSKENIQKNLKEKGFYYIFDNLYIVTTIGSNDTENQKNRAIEDYFPKEFLADIYKDGTTCFENAENKSDNSRKLISKNDFSILIESNFFNDPEIFKNFQILFDIFGKVQFDYLNKLLNRIDNNPSAQHVIFNILDSNFIRNIINENHSLREKFLMIFNKYFLRNYQK